MKFKPTVLLAAFVVTMGLLLVGTGTAQAQSDGCPAPIIDTGGPYDGTVGEAVTFDGTGSIGPIATYEWDFGDGTTAPGATVTHTYSESNRYTARLTVVDDCGDSFALDTQVSIEDAEGPPAPEANAGGPYNGTVGEAVTFDGTGSTGSTGNITSYSWYFGDGTTAAEATVTHTYSTPGTYPVSLTVEDDLGATGVDSTTAVIIREPFVGDVSKVAAEGEPLLDGTVLKQILLDGGVGINASRKVAFGGRASTDNVPGVFTQDGPVVKEGGTLPDGTIVNDLSPFGGVAISVGPSGDRVAFHGETGTGLRDTDTDAVFTQDGLVALEGGTLPDGETVHNIKPMGKVAINEYGEIAFHGKIKIEGDGLDTEELRAVFNQDGLLVKEGDPLPDGTIVGHIDETGGVAINLFGLVAFHGELFTPDGIATFAAVFTQDGLVAKQGDPLPDGSIIAGIDEHGGVAINLFGEVAFHGELYTPDVPPGSVPAVFTQDGLVALEGGTLPDGTIVEEITPSGGVGISFFADVVFHGKAGPTDVVFTQAGLVAAEGMTLPDGETLLNIKPEGKVAINLFGEVAFHGQAGTTDAVFVGQAPLPPAP